MSRLFLIPLALLLLLVLAAAIMVPLLLDKEKILELATAALYEHTGATLTVEGDTELSLFPALGISLSEAAVTLPEKQEPDLRARSLSIGVQLIPLFLGRVAIGTISLDGLILRVESATEPAGVDRRESDDIADAAAALALPLALDVQRLIVTDSRLERVVATNTSTIVELVKFEASGLNLKQEPVPVTLQLRWPGEPGIDMSLDGNIRIDRQAQQLDLDEVTVVLNGATAQPITLQTSGSIDLSREVAKMQLSLALGETRAEGTLRYANKESPRINTHLQMNLFDQALLVLAGPEAAAAASEEEGAVAGDKPLPLAVLRLVDTHAVFDIGQARFGAHTIKQLHADLRAVDGVIQVTELTGDLHGGKLEVSANFNGEQDTATLDTSGVIKGFDIASALAASASEPMLTGTANLSWQLTSRGRSTNELTTALNGALKLTTEEAVLQGTSVEKLLCEAVALTNKERLSAPFSNNTDLETLSADIEVANGKAVLNPLRAALPGIALTGSGNFDLLLQDFTATFKARLSPELEQLDHACRVSQRLTAIDWPIHCAGRSGTERSQWCRVDAGRILQNLTVNEGREKLQKKANKLFNKLFNREE